MRSECTGPWAAAACATSMALSSACTSLSKSSVACIRPTRIYAWMHLHTSSAVAEPVKVDLLRQYKALSAHISHGEEPAPKASTA